MSMLATLWGWVHLSELNTSFNYHFRGGKLIYNEFSQPCNVDTTRTACVAFFDFTRVLYVLSSIIYNVTLMFEITETQTRNVVSSWKKRLAPVSASNLNNSDINALKLWQFHSSLDNSHRNFTCVNSLRKVYQTAKIGINVLISVKNGQRFL